MLSRYGWVMLVPFLEWLWPSRRQKIFRKGLFNDLIHAFQPLSLHPFVVSGLAVSLSYFNITLSHSGLIHLPWYINLIAIILIFEVSFYFFHLASHKIPILWAFHRVHHSSTILDSNSTTRSHIIDKAFFSSPYVLLIMLAKPDPEVLFLYTVFQSFWDRYGHSNVNGPFFTGRIIASPHFHGWHHSTIPEAINKNFSRDFVFMDYLFGTVYYPDKVIPHSFGEPGYSNNILVQHWLPFRHIYDHSRNNGFVSLLLPYPNKSVPHHITSDSPIKSLPLYDFFRLIAALLVVIVHFRFFFGEVIIPDVYASSALSWFFILSGFILAFRYQKFTGLSDVKKFFQHRIARIFPIYYLSIAVGTGLLLITYDPSDFSRLSRIGLLHFVTYDLNQNLDYEQILSALFESLFFLQLFDDNESLKFLINPPLWSLACEAVFYIVFPLLVTLLRPSFNYCRLLLTAALCLGLQAGLITLFIAPNTEVDWYNSNSAIYTNPLVRAPEFFLGIVLYRLFSKVKSYASSRGTAYRWGGFLVLQIILYPIWISYAPTLPFEYALYYFMVPVNALLIYTLARVNWHPSAQWRRIATQIGNLSYPVYALHWPILGLINYYEIGHSLLINYKFVFYLSILCTIVGISLVVLFIFDIPARRFLRNRQLNHPQPQSHQA